MFKKHSLQVQMVKTNKQNTTDPTPTSSLWTPETVISIFEDQTKRLVVGAVTVYAAVKVLNTASEIAIHITTKS